MRFHSLQFQIKGSAEDFLPAMEKSWMLPMSFRIFPAHWGLRELQIAMPDYGPPSSSTTTILFSRVIF